MDKILIELLRRYGIWAIVFLSVAVAAVWFVAHSQATPGDRVSILWGMVEYTKSKSQTERTSVGSEHEPPRISESSTPTGRTAEVREIDIAELTLQLQTCAHSDSDIVCELLITSKADTEPDGFMIHIKGEHKSKIIDYAGKEYFANLVKLGGKENIRSVEDTLYANLPKKASLYFQNVAIAEHQIAVLEVEGFLLPGTRVNASFRDIPISQ